MINSLPVKLINFIHIVIFQIGWLVCAIFGNGYALAYSALYIALHFFLLQIRRRIDFTKEALWLILFLVSGFIIETLFFSVGFLYFDEASAPSNSIITPIIFPPLWLLCLWLLFGITMRTSMAFLFDKLWLAFLLIIIVIPLSYSVGAALNPDVSLGLPHFLSLPAITTAWVGFFGFILALKHFYFGDLFNDR